MRAWRGRVGGLSVIAALVVSGGTAGSVTLPATERVSVDVTGGDADAASSDAATSGTGRFVAFVSAASDLVPDDGNGVHDVFVRDLATGVTARVSVDAQGGDAEWGGRSPSISADGRLVAFISFSSDLVPGDGNGQVDVFVRDLRAGTTRRVSLDAHGSEPDGNSYLPALSPDGRFVGFVSDATDLVVDDGNGARDVFLVDLVTGETTRVSVDRQGADGNDGSGGQGPSISAGGRYVAFDSSASDLVPGDGNGRQDVFVRDMATGRTRRASVDMGGGDPDALSFGPAITADGRHVAFDSMATDLVPDGHDVDIRVNVYVRDLVAGTTTKVSVDSEGGHADGHSQAPSISADGRYVAFDSTATDLAPPAGANPGRKDVFVRDLAAGTTTMVSTDHTGANPNAASWEPAISGDGRYVAFTSDALRMVAGDRNGLSDVFSRRLS